MKCPKCKQPMTEEEDNEKHYICEDCDLFYCFEKGCHCCDDYELEERSKK